VYSFFKSIHFFAAELTGSDKDPNIDIIENNDSEFNHLVHFCEEMIIMSKFFPRKVKTAGMFVVLTFALSIPVFGNAEQYRLDNGMEIILKENHSSPMVASVIFVKSGSKYESKFENGITHFLEHLLFNGTATLTREELDASIQDLGGYINAFTRKELTAFLVLLPKQYIDYGLTVQADMLFNSIIPEEELSKERKIVIEEINRDADAPGAPAEAFFMQKAYAETDYNRPVLGYKSFIENIPRDAIINYWKQYYIPRNMMVLVIGDFDSPVMKRTIKSVFGGFENPSDESDTTGAERLTHEQPAETVKTEFGPVGQQIFDTVANVTSTYINFSFAAPHHSDTMYLAMDLLNRFLAMDEVSPLVKALTGGADPLATDIGVDLATFSEFSRLDIYVITDNPENSDSIVSTVLNQFSAISQHVADPETIEGIKTTARCDEIYYTEKLHFYSFIISSRIMSVGWDFIESYGDRLAQVEWADCQRAAQQWLEEPDYIVTIVKPVGQSGKAPYQPHGLTADEVIAHFATTTFPEYDLVTGHQITYPKTDTVDFELIDKAVYHRESLANGMSVIIKSSSDSRVFAMNVLGKNRSANELPEMAGITDFVNRCLEKGTVTRNAGELSRDLSKIGANVTLYDNPWIPYDDRYTTRRFSFLKFETIDEFAKKGFHLFTEMLLYPAFDSVEVENVRRSMLGTLARNGSSVRNVARDLFYEALFEGKAYAKPIMGTRESISSITVADLKKHHAQYYSPDNIILSIVSGRSVEEVLGWIDRCFGRLSKTGFVSQQAEQPEPVRDIRSAHTDLEKEQIMLYMGSPTPGATSDEAISLTVASSILSNRLGLTLREKQGLAYSVGAGTVLDRNFGWFYAAIGIAAENYQKALDGITFQIEKLKLDGPTQAELNKARNRMWGRLMSAKLSRINQAYYLGVDEYLGREPDYDKTLLEQLSQVTAESVRKVASKYFRTDAYVLATAGKRP
jgi:predicted Zn-dependent peptidase